MAGFTTFLHKASADTQEESAARTTSYDAFREQSIDSSTPTVGLTASNMPDYNSKEVRRILRKCDLRVVAPLMVLYQMSCMDRGNIVNAPANGVTASLDMTLQQFKGALVIYFVAYAVFGIPSNIMMKRIRPITWFQGIIFLWGVTMACQGVTQKWWQLFIVRALVGIFEAGVLPGIVFILTKYYCRFELQRRLAFIYGFASIFEPIMALAALGSHRMDGVIKGWDGWQFSFIGMGIGVMLIGATLRWMLTDLPENAKWLNSYEKDIIERRLAQDSGSMLGRIDLHDNFSKTALWETILDWKVWLMVFVAQCSACCIYGFGYAVHPILSDLGYSVLHTQLLAIPPYVAGMLSTFILSYISDKKQVRWIIIVAALSWAAMGYIVLLSLPGDTSRWGFWAVLYNIPNGAFPAFVTTISWAANNLAPDFRRAVGIALVVCVGNAGGAFGYSVFIESQKPKYWAGYGVSLGACVVGIAITLLMRVAYTKENRRRGRTTAEEVKERYTEAQITSLGDRGPMYQYVL